MSGALLVSEVGGPDAMKWIEREVDAPGPGQIRVRNTAVGVNFIDTYQRGGLYKIDLPFVPGNEGAGIVEALGEGVTDFRVGDRVAYSGPVGAYAEERLLPADKAVPIPDGIEDEAAAALLLKGTTAWYLLFETFKLAAGQSTLIHAGAGGVGQLLTRWAKALGATVYATAGSDEKVAICRANGVDAAINYSTEDFVSRIKELTGGKGVDVVYDGVGKATFDKSLDCLRPRGLMASFGNASGVVSIPDLTVLSRKGSLFVTRPTTAHYLGTKEAMRRAASAVFDAYKAGILRAEIGGRYPLREAAEAHRALEARATTGSLILQP